MAYRSQLILAPGQNFPHGEELPPNMASTTATTSPTSTNAPPHSGHTISGGEIAGVAVGGVFAVAVAGALLFFLGRHRKELEFLRRDLHVQRRQGAFAGSELNQDHSRLHDSEIPLTSPSVHYSPDDIRLSKNQPQDAHPLSELQTSSQPRVAELAGSDANH